MCIKRFDAEEQEGRVIDQTWSYLGDLNKPHTKGLNCKVYDIVSLSYFPFKNVEKIERSRVHSTEVKATARVQYLLPEAKATEVASGKAHAILVIIIRIYAALNVANSLFQ